MTPERLAEIRHFHEEEVEIANEGEGFPGELTEEVHIIQDLLAEVDRLKANLARSTANAYRHAAAAMFDPRDAEALNAAAEATEAP